MKDIEIEIQVRVEQTENLRKFLNSKAKLKMDNRQVDEYYIPPDRDFTKERPLKEWLRLRESNGKYSINYKNWYYDGEGKSHHCDEYETLIGDIDKIKNVFKALNIKSIVTVNKYRKSWDYEDFEISLDSIKDLGDFVEIEYKGKEDVDPKKTTDEMIEFLIQQKCGRIERNYLGYPFQIMFPDEVEWEVVYDSKK